MVNAADATPEILTTHRSPNHTERRGVTRPDMIVLHYTGMETPLAAVARLCDPAAEVSAHYVIDPSGAIFGLVDEDRRAWHAGRSQWGAVTDVNSHSIGIEIANPGHHLGYPPFPEPQMRSVESLIARAMGRWAIPPERVVGHACIAPGRKIDPGEKMDWRRLAQQGLAVWLDRPEWDGPVTQPNHSSFANLARTIGYAAPVVDGPLDWSDALSDLWRAIAMRFMPASLAKDTPDFLDIVHLGQIAERWPVVDPDTPTS